MQKASYKLAILTAVLGLLFLLPLPNQTIYLFLIFIHVLLGLMLAILLIRLIYSHIPEELYNPFKRGYKKWNGFKLTLYLFLAIFSGIFLLFFSYKWINYFHGFIGLWAILVGWKHKR